MPAAARAAAARRSGSGREIDGAALTTAAGAGVDERLGRDPVEVGVVDDRDVARLRAA